MSLPAAVPAAASVTTPAGANPQNQPLPPLREELLLHEAPHDHDGTRAWTLEDPGRARFFQINWEQAEMLARWHLGRADAVAQAIRSETTLHTDAADVGEFARFLDTNSLLQLRGKQAVERYVREANARKVDNWANWAMHNYLFIRIPLWRPDSFLRRTLPLVRRWFLNRRFARLTMLVGLLGVFLAARQWDTFVHTFLHFFTLEGAAIAGLALGSAKVLHELGHAYVARHHGCRVATMGVAFMVMWPVLYTDVSGAWRLGSRRRRLSIGAAGMGAELALAAWSTLAWSFLPDGMWRSAAFMLATTTWIMTLAVNLNPFMRFDGYFILSDLLNVPNLQQRAFALARWRLREWLFGLGDDKPETFVAWRERTLMMYAFCVWIYRFFLFLGIALVVYHFAFKLLGILLFVVEIVYFVLKPIYTELKAWHERLRGKHAPGWNRRSKATLAVLLVLCLLAVIPWRSRIHAPALLRAAEQVRLVAPADARVAQMLVQPGQQVTKGEVLFVLQAPDLEHELAVLNQRIGTLAWQRDFHMLRRDTAAATPVAAREWQAALERRAVLERQRDNLSVRAPFDGVVADQAQPLAEGEWLGAGEWLATLVAPQAVMVEAYVGETDLHRVQPGDAARFLPEDPGLPSLSLTTSEVAGTATRRLSAAPELASTHGGAIAAVQQPTAARTQWDNDAHAPVPEQAVYRILLQPADKADPWPAPLRTWRGVAVIQGESESLFVRAWRRVTAVLVRELGF